MEFNRCHGMSREDIRQKRSTLDMQFAFEALLPNPQFKDYYRNLCNLGYEEEPNYFALQECLVTAWTVKKSQIMDNCN